LRTIEERTKATAHITAPRMVLFTKSDPRQASAKRPRAQRRRSAPQITASCADSGHCAASAPARC
jgi:hypothetical protein